MAIGRRKERQEELFIAANQISKGSGHPFYERLASFLKKSGFDEMVEGLCEEYYKKGGRPGIPPGVYFRMLFIGYFEGIESQRGIAWRCADSLALRDFLGYAVTEATPVHNSMTMIRQRLPHEVFQNVFVFTIKALAEGGFLKGKAFGVDATTLEANAAMRSIVRKDNGEDWPEFLRNLARAEGMEDPSDEDIQRMDRKRKAKKVSNKEWESPTDPDSRITKMKDGRTHLGYKAEHTVQLDSQAIVSAHIDHSDQGDTSTLPKSVALAAENLSKIEEGQAIEEVVADKGYHSNETLKFCNDCGLRSYIAEPAQPRDRKWTDKPEEQQTNYRNHRQRMKRPKAKKLGRLRSERVERTFAHVCETGGSRRTHLRGIENVSKIHQIKCGAYNLGLLLRLAYGLGKPRSGSKTPMGTNKAKSILNILIYTAIAHLVSGSKKLCTQISPRILPPTTSNFTSTSYSNVAVINAF